MKIFKRLIYIAFLLLCALALIIFGYYLAVTKNVALSPEKLLLSDKNITVFDGDGMEVKTALALKQNAKIENIQKHTKQAFIAIEDKRFYKHNGFDWRRIVKAALKNAKSKSFKEGASTISQQLIKNTHLCQEKTIKRKLQEWKLTNELEKRYTKNEILEKYLNSIYFGHSCFGIQAAAEFYFGKNPEELTIADSAILAGLVKSPNNYSPFKSPESCLRRRNSVLSFMLANGFIDELQKNEAMREPLPERKTTKKDDGYLTFVFDELSALSEEYHFKIGGNIRIFTHLDQALQAKTEEILSHVTDCNKTAVVLDKHTGCFKTCVSDVGNIPRLPGSLIKPLLVYAPAIEEDILSPATPILDEKVDYNGYQPNNYDNHFHGYVSARESVEKSLNIPAVKTLSALGVSKGAAYLESLGLSVEESDLSLALALGGMKRGFTLTDLASAYSAFQHEGMLPNSGFIEKISINGNTVYQKTKSFKKVFSDSTSFLMTDMLKGVAKTGTAKKLRNLPFEIAAKTGTAGTEHGNTDAYALSYTTMDCAAVWLGNAEGGVISHTGGGEPCNALLKINEYLYEQYQSKQIAIPPFPSCEDVTLVDLDKTIYSTTHTFVLADKNAPSEYRLQDWFKTSNIPLKQSNFFSNPTILSPTISLKNNKIEIVFDENCPRYYQYKIERSDYDTHTTVYEGDFISVFIDPNIQNDKIYIYTVTPLYKERYGTPIRLPVISTKNGALITEKEQEMLEKEWWEY
ncbi:MAG: hypothetical protein E7366_03910 [Clostridiales bacterium]|nr:hypothetical protein [Clostridiales bacterium]